ncbi:hypothetical protein DFH07DRAFT_811487 [Mycena maculata]|uniref:F-box domain-containing protein n=1 Tax=Mycena maculata TaxID=230809 RepID=A0AAD7JGV6_9AGAR|nr:hypothetical protein DFH07DRAFT_811487 [Mycena maculata]
MESTELCPRVSSSSLRMPMKLNPNGPKSQSFLLQSSPAIFSLPHELLVEIAAIGQEDREALADGVFRPEWNLSHVCRRFRHTITEAATLWTYMEVDLNFEGSVEVAKLYFSRSRACKIWVTLHGHRTQIGAHAIAERLGHFLPNVNRIWWFEIFLERAWTSDSVFAPFQTMAAPALEHLEIHGAPNFRSLKLNSCKPDFPVLSWAAHLTHLEFRAYGYREDSEGNTFFATILKQCTSLESLVVIPNGGATKLWDALFHFAAPALSDLVVHNTHGDQISVLFDSTSLYHSSFLALTSLSFVTAGCICGDDSNVRAAFKTVSSPPLRLLPALSSLTLINLCFTEDILSDILGADSAVAPPANRFNLPAGGYVGRRIHFSPADCAFETPTRPADPGPPAFPRPILQSILGREQGRCGVV